jgi:hypothetical protein
MGAVLELSDSGRCRHRPGPSAEWVSPVPISRDELARQAPARAVSHPDKLHRTIGLQEAMGRRSTVWHRSRFLAYEPGAGRKGVRDGKPGSVDDEP